MALVDKKVKPFKLNAFKPGAEDFVTVSSDDISGKWSVFFFYPADFTFVCPILLRVMKSTSNVNGRAFKIDNFVLSGTSKNGTGGCGSGPLRFGISR